MANVLRMEPRPGSSPGHVNEDVELTYLRAGSEPVWERPHRDGVDVTDRPELWSPYQRQRRLEFEARVQAYRAAGLL